MKIGEHFFQGYRVSAKGLAAQRSAMGAATENLANAQTTRTADGTPYKAKKSVQQLDDNGPVSFRKLLGKLSSRLSLQGGDGRHLLPTPRKATTDLTRVDELGPETEIVESDAGRLEYDPAHPHADENGYVAYPDINIVEEMATLVSANRLYEANLAAVQAITQSIKRTIDI